MEDIKKVIADRLDVLMAEAEKHGKNQKQISIETGIPSNSLSQYHNGSREIKPYNLIKLAKYFNVSTDYLLGLTDTKSTNLDVQEICKQTYLSEETLKTICLIAFIDGKKTYFDDFIKADDDCGKMFERFANFHHHLLFYLNQLFEKRDIFIEFLKLYAELSFRAAGRRCDAIDAQKFEMQLIFYKMNEETYANDASWDRFRLSQEVLKFLDAVEYPDTIQSEINSVVPNFNTLPKEALGLLEASGYFERHPELRPTKHLE